LETGLAVLASEGVSAVRVEHMARQLGVAKSGFYWHFADRDDLLRAMLDFWIHEYNEVVTSNVELEGVTGEERLRRTMHMINDHDLTQYDLSIRAWAACDPHVARVLRKAYRTRLEFIRNALAECGFKGDALELRARLFLVYHSWESATMWGESKKATRHFIEQRLALLLRK